MLVRQSQQRLRGRFAGGFARTRRIAGIAEAVASVHGCRILCRVHQRCRAARKHRRRRTDRLDQLEVLGDLD